MTTMSKTDLSLTENRLVQLHVEIARRADQLAQRQRGPRSREIDLQCWLEAEREVLGRVRGEATPRAS
jgi:hypothetical protein